ncbi:MAG: hypothetical protein AAGA20_12880 [Planctomycetota bacterium]
MNVGRIAFILAPAVALALSTLHVRAQSSVALSDNAQHWSVSDDLQTISHSAGHSSKTFSIRNTSDDEVCVILYDRNGNTYIREIAPSSVVWDVLPAYWRMRITDKERAADGSLQDDENSTGASGDWRLF